MKSIVHPKSLSLVALTLFSFSFSAQQQRNVNRSRSNVINVLQTNPIKMNQINTNYQFNYDNPNVLNEAFSNLSNVNMYSNVVSFDNKGNVRGARGNVNVLVSRDSRGGNERRNVRIQQVQESNVDDSNLSNGLSGGIELNVDLKVPKVDVNKVSSDSEVQVNVDVPMIDKDINVNVPQIQMELNVPEISLVQKNTSSRAGNNPKVERQPSQVYGGQSKEKVRKGVSFDFKRSPSITMPKIKLNSKVLSKLSVANHCYSQKRKPQRSFKIYVKHLLQKKMKNSKKGTLSVKCFKF